MKPIPMGPSLAEILKKWKNEARYAGPDDWVFAKVALEPGERNINRLETAARNSPGG